MPAETFNQAWKDVFTTNIYQKIEQELAKTAPYVTTVPLMGERMFYDRLGGLEDRELSGRYNLVQWDTPEFDRRMMTRREFAVAVPVDENDVEFMLTDPTSALVQKVVAALQRRKDRIALEAALGSVRTGKDGTTTVTAAADGVRTVNATGGLTYEKILEINQNFIDDEVSVDDNVRQVIFLTGKEHTQLMGETEFISADYTRQFVIEAGRIKTVMGNDIVKFGANATNPILSVSGGVRDCIAMATGAILLGIQKDIDLKVDERKDYHHTTQITATLKIGGMRMEGKRVQKLTTTP